MQPGDPQADLCGCAVVRGTRMLAVDPLCAVGGLCRLDLFGLVVLQSCSVG